jgi:pyruvate dehydrogenase E2 component (dihydrolipoamide acetyltransferase)
VFASPLAKRLARDAGIDISRIAGSGPHGRIVAHDVEQAKTGGGLRAPATAQGGGMAIAPMADDKIRALYKPGTYDVVPHDSMRKTIARRLVEAKATIPHFYLTVSCNIDRLMAAREDINMVAPKGADGKPAWKVSVNDFVIKAMAMALMKVPAANVTWTEGGMLQHREADVGVAVSIPGGLITPIVRSAQSKKLTDISNEMRDLATRARNKKLKPSEYEGGTTAVSNLGMFGIHEFSAVINPPQATILAVGTGEQRPIVKDGKIEVATLMTVTLSCDHRAVDGALGAEFLGAFKSFIENPVGMVM